MLSQEIPDLAQALAQREITSRSLVESALRRYDETEPTVRAFAWLDRERALRLADRADEQTHRGEPRGPLHGIPIGVKDIIDTAGIPTERGSAVFAGRVPDRDAALVTNLAAAGAIVFGKTVTAELAFYHPGPTRNPHDPERTPGGSSMGSAAAVGAGVVPGAIGSQTNGSIIRPAAFCGVAGMKATHGRVPVEGVFPFAPTLDHPGPMARTVEGCAWLLAAITATPLEQWWDGDLERTPRFAALRTADWERADDAMRQRFQADVDRIATLGGPVAWPAPPDGLDSGVEVLTTIMAYESARTIGVAIRGQESEVSRIARDLFERGANIPDATYEAALAERQRLIDAWAEWVAPYDAVLTPPALGEAPPRATTGDPRFCSRWSLLGVPAVTIPTGRGPHGLPLGLQLVGTRGQDRRVLRAAAWGERVLARA